MAVEALHLDHGAVRAEARSWYLCSAPEIGYEVHRHRFGDTSDLATGDRRLILHVDTPVEVEGALSEAGTGSADQRTRLTIRVDERERAARLASTLARAGCSRLKATTHRALAGAVQAGTGSADLESGLV
jgi:hypothetical protein